MKYDLIRIGTVLVHSLKQVVGFEVRQVFIVAAFNIIAASGSPFACKAAIR